MSKLFKFIVLEKRWKRILNKAPECYLQLSEIKISHREKNIMPLNYCDEHYN